MRFLKFAQVCGQKKQGTDCKGRASKEFICVDLCQFALFAFLFFRTQTSAKNAKLRKI
jgi:hypothetical protein